MKAIMVMFDSLNRHMLQPYGCDITKTPNFLRLAEKAVTFETCFAGSLPCMPARRELHTGRYNFLNLSLYCVSIMELFRKSQEFLIFLEQSLKNIFTTAALTFSSICSGLDAPIITLLISLCCRIHASESCAREIP